MDRIFKLKENNTTIGTEVRAGITTYLTMAYILMVNPAILSAAGMDRNAVFTATAISAAFATIFMGFVANLPFALAPGMGLNAYLAFTVCGKMGIPWQTAMAAVFIEGIIFILLTVFNIREAIMNCIPAPIKSAISVGIGLFIALIGFVAAGIVKTGMEIIPGTEKLDGTVTTLGNIQAVSTIVAIIGIVMTAILVIKNVKGGILIGMIATTVISILTGVTVIEDFHFVSLPPSIEPIFMKFDFSNVFSLEMFIILFTLLFVDMFDTIGTLIGVCTKANMLTADGKIPKAKRALLADAVGTTFGAVLGTSTVTTFVESASGVAEGGRTGLSAIVTGILFAVSLFFSNLFLSVPVFVTSSALIIIGVFMMAPVTKINWEKYEDAIPAFMTIALMPFTYSIAEGISFGVMSYVAIRVFSFKFKGLKLSTGILALFFVLKYTIPFLEKFM